VQQGGTRRQPEVDAVPGLVELIYGSVFDAARWQLVLDQFVSAVGAQYGALVSFEHDRPDAPLIHVWSGWKAEDVALFAARYAANDPWRIHAYKRPEGFVGPDTDLCSREELESSESYRKFLEPRGAVHGFGGAILNGPAGQSIITAARSAEDGPFGEAELELLRRLMPHLRQAVLLHARFGSLRAQVSTFRRHLDRYSCALVLTDRALRPLFANASARELAARTDGLNIEQGRLTLMPPRLNAKLKEVVEKLSSGRDRDLHRIDIPRPAGGAALRLLVMQVPESGTLPLGASVPSVALMIIDTEFRPALDPEVLRHAFALTPAESRVAAKLGNGKSIDEIAVETGTSTETVRTHVKRIFSKTGTSRQGELISLLLQSSLF
jgi:DNA-binding CsgD family transcriptional regulator